MRIPFAFGTTLAVVIIATAAAQAQQKPAEKPKAPIVIVSGCAKPGTNPAVWTLSNASARTEAQQPALNKEEQDAATKVSLGSDSYELVGVADFIPADMSHAVGNRKDILTKDRVNTTGKLQGGHKVIVKGLYIAGTPSRINVTSVVDLAPTCP
jgi:hypothetical protein